MLFFYFLDGSKELCQRFIPAYKKKLYLFQISTMEFQTWSEQNKAAKEELCPNIGLRSWDELLVEDKYKIWQHLYKAYFFDKKPVGTRGAFNNSRYKFFGDSVSQSRTE